MNKLYKMIEIGLSDDARATFFMQIHTRHHHGESETPSVAHSRNHPMMNVNNAFCTGFLLFFYH